VPFAAPNKFALAINLKATKALDFRTVSIAVQPDWRCFARHFGPGPRM